MIQRRIKYFRVYGISILSENKITLFEDQNQQVAENFALKFDGDAKEIYIEPVYKLTLPVNSDHGREL